MFGQPFYILAVIALILYTPIEFIRLIKNKDSKILINHVITTITLTVSCIMGIVIGGNIRINGMKSFTERSEPLIQAIEKFNIENGRPPDHLTDLVPKYIANIPGTGMMAYPEYQYFVGDDAMNRYVNNPWALEVNTPSGGINFDIMLYFPNGNYPKTGYGGSLEIVNKWAYVHE